jgi:hypothetical protein
MICPIAIITPRDPIDRTIETAFYFRQIKKNHLNSDGFIKYFKKKLAT